MSDSRKADSLKSFQAAAKRALSGRYELVLYIAGTTPLSATALSNVVALCDELLPGRYDLTVVDVYQEPVRTQADQIVAVPTLLKKAPSPVRRIIGDLSDRGKVVAGLGIPRKPVMKKSRPADSELTDVRARLEEAEETLHAIRSGHVDALIVSGAAGERVFTMQGADHRYRLLVEGMNEGAVIVSLEGVVLYANKSFARLLGAPLDRVLGSRFLTHVHPGSVAGFAHLVANAPTDAGAVELTLVGANQQNIAVRISAAVDGEGAFGGTSLVVTDLSLVLRDLHARIEAENALSRAQERERQFRELIDNMPELAWNARPDGYIDFYNRRWYEYTGTSQDESAGWGWTEVHDPLILPAIMERWQHSIATGEPFEMEFPLRRADGEFRWFLTRIRALRDEQGRIVRWFGTNTDVDDVRREQKRAEALAAALSVAAEARTRALEEAQRVSHAKDEFLATMSHELRTPLNAMLGWASMLQGDRLDPAQITRGLAVIVRNAHTQARLVDDLLDVSRIISGKLRLAVRRVEVAAVIHAAIDVVRQAADAKNIRITLDLAPALGVLLVDPDRLQQVAWNLLSNAVKFTPTGGTVAIVSYRVAAHLRLQVHDNGSGVPAEHLPFIFERLRQVDGTTTRKYGGLGLGLAIVRHLVEAHGGTVRAQSPGELGGASFTVDLPIHEIDSAPAEPTPQAENAPTADAQRAAQPRSPLGGLRVLVVEDDEDSLDMLRIILGSAGALTVCVRRAVEALEQTANAQFDVIVSDIGMPEMDGYMFLRALRERSTDAPTPAIALTAYARLEDGDTARAAGYQEHLTKPVDTDALLAAVARLAGKQA